MADTATKVRCTIGRSFIARNAKDWPGFRAPCPKDAVTYCRVEDDGSLMALCADHNAVLTARGVIEPTL